MEVKGKKIGFVLTGSFCTFQKVIPIINELKKREAHVLPIMSYNSFKLDTKFGKAQYFIDKIEGICEEKIIHTIQDAEPIGPKHLTDIMIVAEEIISIKKKLNEILAKNTKQPLSKIEQDTERDFYMDAQKALEYGIIDGVITNR